DIRTMWDSPEVKAFPEYYEQYFKAAMQFLVRPQPLVCVAPVTYRGQDAVQADIAHLKAALQQLGPGGVEEAFMPSTAPRSLGRNEYYATEDEFRQAIAEAIREEYLAIVDAGFILQIDDPALAHLYSLDGRQSREEKVRTAERYIEIINHALRGIPQERVRFHCCYGINEGPRVHDASLRDYVSLMLKINAAAYSFEVANPRHLHEWHVWEDIELPAGKVIIPGMISHATNIVEHPELIAELLVNYARLVGRENVMAGADCGFSSQATHTPEVHPSVVWAKFRALAEGARLASQRLW
ncbi:MAG: methionine synthase, partial [Chloroflexota bacterium]|nr:methionine synthase [Chloroflexota bacterium]